MFLESPYIIASRNHGKPLTTMSKFPNATGKMMIGETLVSNGEEITNAMIGYDVLTINW